MKSIFLTIFIVTQFVSHAQSDLKCTEKFISLEDFKDFKLKSGQFHDWVKEIYPDETDEIRSQPSGLLKKIKCIFEIKEKVINGLF